MVIPFFKYQGAGNDFILIDHRSAEYFRPDETDLIRRLCDRHYGIGADGLMLLREVDGFDFEMVYFNSDGREGTMCGNGGRCIVAFARHLGLIRESCRFLAVDGVHEAWIRPDHWVELRLGDVQGIERGENYYFLNTGSPHYVSFVEDIQSLDVVRAGRNIRYSDRFRETGTNVNFVQERGPALITVATYERGVEEETLSCGTGVTASAIAHHLAHPAHPTRVSVQTRGGDLQVRFRPGGTGFEDVWLCGPAQFVFEGRIGLTSV